MIGAQGVDHDQEHVGPRSGPRGLGLGAASGGLSGYGNFGGVGKLGTMSTVAHLAGFEGMGFALRKQMKAKIADMICRTESARALVYRLGRMKDAGVGRASLEASMANLQKGGVTIPDEIARHIAPLGWAHIGLTGDYLWNMNPPFGTDRLRPLRKDEVHDAS